MDEKTGVARLRQAITNQATCGSGQFELSIDSADKLCREIEAELENPSWAEGVPAPRDADGEVVPLTTEAMCDIDGREHKVNFYSFAPESGYWTVNIDKQSDSETHVIEGFHLHRPDSWELLEEDVKKSTCEYFDHKGKPCLGCPAKEHPDCIDERAKDTIRRAKALAERDAMDRPTCTMTYRPEWSGDEIYPTAAYQCSNCGCVVNEGITDYCPSCGYRVSNSEMELER